MLILVYSCIISRSVALNTMDYFSSTTKSTGSLLNEGKYFKIMYLRRSLYSKYIKSSVNSIAKKWTVWFYKGQKIWIHTFLRKTHRWPTGNKRKNKFNIANYQFSSVAQLCLTLCNSMNRSMPGLPVHHQLPEFTQTHVHGVGDAIQPSHPLSSPFPPAPNSSQHQSLFQWVNSLHEVAKVLEFQL